MAIDRNGKEICPGTYVDVYGMGFCKVILIRSGTSVLFRKCNNTYFNIDFYNDHTETDVTVLTEEEVILFLLKRDAKDAY